MHKGEWTPPAIKVQSDEEREGQLRYQEYLDRPETRKKLDNGELTMEHIDDVR